MDLVMARRDKGTTRWTIKKRRFVEAYCGEAMFNASLAARIAGYPRETAGQIAYRIMQCPKVRRRINKKLAKLAMSGEEAMARLTEMARGSVEPFLVPSRDGEVVIDISSETARKNLRLVRKIKQTETRVIRGRGEDKEVEVIRKTELELHDAKDANIQMAKIRGMYTERDKNGDPLQPLYKVYVGVNPDDV